MQSFSTGQTYFLVCSTQDSPVFNILIIMNNNYGNMSNSRGIINIPKENIILFSSFNI